MNPRTSPSGIEAVRPLKFLNDSERAALAARAASAHAEWRAAWRSEDAAADPAPVDVECKPAAEAADVAGDGDWLAFATARGTLHIADAPRARATIVAILSGSSDAKQPAAGSIAAELVGRALQDLAQRIAGDAVERSVEGAPPADVWLPASGAAAIEWRSAQGTVRAIADQRLVALLLSGMARPARRGAPLVNPQHCLGRQPVELRVWLGNAELDLALLQSLAVNDVILLDGRIDEPLRVTVAGRDVATRAFLGKAGGQKAIRLAGQLPH